MLRTKSAAVVACFAAGIGLWTTTSCGAEDYPAASITIVVPMAPGGTTDFLPRVIGEVLREKWKHPVIVENRAGAGGNIGADYVARAKPDGYTLLLASDSLIGNMFTFKNPPLDVPKALKLVATTIQGPRAAFMVKADAPWKNMADLTAYLSARGVSRPCLAARLKQSRSAPIPGGSHDYLATTLVTGAFHHKPPRPE